MGDTSRDPVDHARTTRQHAGESMKNGHNAPGLIGVALGVVSLFIGLAAFASGGTMAGVICVSVSAVAFIAGGTWLFLAHRRVRRQELEWADKNPRVDSDVVAQPPTS
ncbi:protein UsfY [Mycolicibacterium sediminis]|uniref:UsfY protein n=1 Tax=Mycolicibacterium sediminis TaxID=1286180 RepID=A0A7I7R0C1_9MYCO|nr:protein UsfY [Mycolicibacterium sediminis]BBY31667.1 UsfY protein [Mycolicibacterium sediminis]